MPKKHDWSVVRRCQIWGAIVGASLTVGLLIVNFTSSSHNYGPGILLGIISVPSAPLLIVLRLFGLQMIHMNSVMGSFFLTVVNALSFFVLGICFGGLIVAFKHRK